MAKIRHNDFIDTVDRILGRAKNERTIHLYAEGNALEGRIVQIEGKKLFHFATTSYLGLEYDSRLKEAAISAIKRYGTQFPLSKTYISHPLYHELETSLQTMYGMPVIVSKNSTLGHLAVIPTLVNDEDGVILDHQVHWSVQNACQLLKLRGIPVDMIRHNNLQMLEDRIKELSLRCKKIWYMADGVYSMFGDYAPIWELTELSKKYSQLQLYFDDVHGMSWRGKNGTGLVLDILKVLPDNVFLMGTLSKSFGASGAIFLCTNEKLRERIKNFGGPLTFSAQLEPASVAAAIASANIHLSPEINLLQEELAQNIAYFNLLISKTSLLMIEPNDSPVFYLGTGKPLTAYRLVQRLFNEGFFVNPGLYPAVPVKNTGIRITISRNNKQDDIKGLVQVIEYHFPKVMEETSNSIEKIRKAFQMRATGTAMGSSDNNTALKIQYEASIRRIDRKIWNELLGKQSVFDWNGLCYLEDAFKNSSDTSNSWSFHYYLITDKEGTPVLATFFTCALWKDDMLSPISVSIQLEEERLKKTTYLTSKVLGMGSLFTEGEHCFINRKHLQWKEAIVTLIEKSEELCQELSADMLVFRDFHKDSELDMIFHDQGFIKADMPETAILQDLLSFNDIEQFTSILSTRSKRHFLKEVLPFEKEYDIIIKTDLTDEEIKHCYQLYRNVKDRNFAVNTFTYPIKVFENMINHPDWEFILLYLKRDVESIPPNPLVGVMFCYKNEKYTYVPSLIGMDYTISREFQLYRQLLYQTIKRAKKLKFKRIDFGITASFEKRKLGATIIPKIAYIQAKDNFSMELMNTMRNENGNNSIS
jgi:7-keto-8-aminopelargonate synthetase-like enzyme